MRGLPAALSLPFLLVVGALQAGSAQAAPGPIQLVSRSATEHADFAETPALSLDGRFVAFRGSLGGRMGILRRDLTTGAIAEVVAGDAYTEPPDATEPSISADGRFVAFTTTASLDPTNDDLGGTVEDSDVYVADMGTTPPTYELASALDGSSAGLSYADNAGSIASGRVSLSAGGRELVFVTSTASNLTGSPAALETPRLQVAVRNLATRETRLVSSSRDPLSGAMEAGVPVSGGAVASNPTSIAPGAALSADGSAVAWLGANVGAQAPLLSDEAAEIAGGALLYDEPLWRRVPTAAELSPPTRRVVGGGDPLAPGCPVGGTLAVPACRGPFPDLADGHPNLEFNQCASANGWIAGRSRLDFVPKLSADGRTVALLGEPNGFANVFVARMDEGLPRVQAVSQLTREVPIAENNGCRTSENLATAGDITGVAISPGGDRAAFTTQRQQFPLAPPNLIGGPPAGMGIAELYLVDLGGKTLERLTHGATASEPSKRLEEAEDKLNGALGAATASFDAGGETLAFSSRASNLVPGDGNGEMTGALGSDAFLVTYPRVVSGPDSSRLSPPPPPILPRPRRRLVASAASRPDGSVRLTVSVPGAGRLGVKARTSAGLARTVTAAGRRVRTASVVSFSLRAEHRYLRLVRSKSGLEAKLEVRFSGPGGKPLRDVLDVRFRDGRRGAERRVR